MSHSTTVRKHYHSVDPAEASKFAGTLLDAIGVDQGLGDTSDEIDEAIVDPRTLVQKGKTFSLQEQMIVKRAFGLQTRLTKDMVDTACEKIPEFQALWSKLLGKKQEEMDKTGKTVRGGARALATNTLRKSLKSLRK